jgi:hypothetical protein
VRCIFRSASAGDYEERITLWRARSSAKAIAAAEKEAKDYCKVLTLKYVGLAQSYKMFDVPEQGAEVFSLIRRSSLKPNAYLDRFFDTGAEIQGRIT